MKSGKNSDWLREARLRLVLNPKFEGTAASVQAAGGQHQLGGIELGNCTAFAGRATVAMECVRCNDVFVFAVRRPCLNCKPFVLVN